jgi:hypothetical protein
MDAEGGRRDDGGGKQDGRNHSDQLSHDSTLAARAPTSSHPWVLFGWLL